MALNLSAGQKLAVDTKNKNILVSAAAGSGKTFVLTQRVLSGIINDKWDIDSFLIVTFTRDAAAEMKSRIRKALEKKLAETDSKELSQHIEKQLILINKANISTIDSFCSNVVRQNFHKTDLDSGYKTPTQVEISELKNQAADNMLNELLSGDDKEFMNFYNKFAGKSNDNNLVKMVTELYEFADSLPYPQKWFEKCVNDYKVENFYDSIWGKIYISKTEDYIKKAREYAQKAVSYLKFTEPSDYPSVIKKVFDLIDDFEAAYKLEGIKGVSKLQVKFTINLKSIKDEQDLVYVDVIKRYLNFTKDALNNALKYSSLPEEKIAYSYENVKADINSLVKAVILFSQKYKELKLEKQMAEFNDISHYCLNILRDEQGNTTDTAKEYQKKFKEIIIDEYQDSNDLQEEILTAVSRCESGENNIFMVGDIKQAIYRFRQTTPELFIKKYDKYSSSKEDEALILLSENYRSRKTVLDTCNIIFKQIMDRQLGNVDYTDEVALNCKGDFPLPDNSLNISKNTDVIIIDTFLQDDEEPQTDPKTAEAAAVAQKINHMLNVDPLYIYDKELKEYRPLCKKDIVILVNRRTNAGVFYEELNSAGISCVFETADPLFKTTEIKLIISLLRLIDNPYNDIDIVNVLHSPVYCLSFDDIAEIRLENRELDIYSSILEYAQSSHKISSVLNNFLNDLNYYRDFAIHNSLSELITEIYDKSNFFSYTGILNEGGLKQANLRLFRERAVEFEANPNADIHTFLNYIDTDLSDEVLPKDKESSASLTSEGEDAVRIMTIHKSKGLEFPVVFVSQLQNSFNRRFKANDYIFDRELGIGLKYIDNENRIRYRTQPYDIIIEKYEEEELSENLRLLYVALTRAVEKLIITGVATSAPSKTGKYAQLNDIAEDKTTLLPFPVRTLADCPLFWVLSALKRTELYPNNIIKQNWINIKNVTGLSDLKGEAALSIMDKINNAQKESGNTYTDIIEERLNYTYPYKAETLIPSKISITEIKRKMTEESDDTFNYYSSSILKGSNSFGEKESSFTFAQMGTLYHTVMEYMDFDKISSPNDAELFLKDLLDREIITNEELEAISIEKIKKFIASPLFSRIKNSQGIYREVPFVMSMRASRLNEFKNSNSEIVVHGIIDLYFVENNNIILVDYKTDKVYKNLQELSHKYNIQLALYKEALEKNTGAKISQCLIYSLDKGEALNVEF